MATVGTLGSCQRGHMQEAKELAGELSVQGVNTGGLQLWLGRGLL